MLAIDKEMSMSWHLGLKAKHLRLRAQSNQTNPTDENKGKAHPFMGLFLPTAKMKLVLSVN
jgi:hypothetical protein